MAPRIPSGYTKPSAATNPVPTDQRQRQTKEPVGQIGAQDVDQLASGLKKMSIKLNVPPKAEQQAREAKKVAEKKKIVTRAPRKSAVQKIPKMAPTSKLDATKVPPPSLKSEAHLPAQNDLRTKDGSSATEEGGVPVTPCDSSYIHHMSDDVPATNIAGAATPPPSEFNHADLEGSKPMSADAVLSIPYTPNPFDAAAPMGDPTSDMPPPPATDAALSPGKRSKHELPVFSASSPIPFGNPTTLSSDGISASSPLNGLTFSDKAQTDAGAQEMGYELKTEFIDHPMAGVDGG